MKRIRRAVMTFNSYIPTKRDPWWAWPLALFGVAFICATAALFVYPQGTHEELWLFGLRFGGDCGMKIQFGIPCPQCGMTRSWVSLARGHFAQSFFYSPAGFILFFWILAGGLIGLLRLLFRKPNLLAPPWTALFIWCMFWFLGPYTSLYFARLGGINPLPEYNPQFESSLNPQP